MIDIRRGTERGASRIDWLDSKHTFSFAEYMDPKHMGFRALRVINEDKVTPGAGFGTHGHRDMEIVSYVLDGAIAHKDSTGVGATIRPGDVQRMTAGSGVHHSEFNPSPNAPLHFLQIWIVPDARGLAPGYEQKSFPTAEKKGRLRLVASRDGREGSVTIHQDVDLYALWPVRRICHGCWPRRAVGTAVSGGSRALHQQSFRSPDACAAHRDCGERAHHEIPRAYRHRCPQGVFSRPDGI